MIPKIIHYCWFGKKDKPDMMKICINSWKRVMPDYEIKEWNEDNVDLHCSPWVENAYRLKKWAFVADYIRFKILYEEGGLYLDTDVYVKKHFDIFMSNRLFTAWDFPISQEKLIGWVCDKDGNFIKDPDAPMRMYMCGILVAVLGSEKRHPLLKDCLDFYDSFGDENPIEAYNKTCIICDDIVLSRLWKYGMKMLDNHDQYLDEGIAVYRPTVFWGGSVTYQDKEDYAVHLCSSSWRDDGRNVLWKRISKTWYIRWMDFKCRISFLSHV